MPDNPKPDDLLITDATKLTSALLTAAAEETLLYLAGDHWQNGRQWTGPALAPGDVNRDASMTLIGKSHVSKNAISEGLDRHTNAVVGREPGWSFTPRRALELDEAPTRDEQGLIDEANAVLTAWWDRRQALKRVREAAELARATGRAHLRLFVPPGLLDANGRVPRADLSESLARLHLMAPKTGTAAVITDDETMQRYAVYTVKRDSKDAGEVISLNSDGRTIIRSLGTKDERTPTGEPLELNGQLTITELELPALVTPQVKSNQNLLNMARTMLARNAVLGGFLERYGINILPPGEWKDDPARPGQQVFVPGVLKAGADTFNFYTSQTYVDEQGNMRPMPGSIGRFEPVSPDTFLKTEQAAYYAILDEMRQAHVKIAGDAVTSGAARIQATQDFISSLDETKAEVDAAGRWLLETALAMAAHFSGKPGRFSSLRAVFDCRITAVQPTAEDRNATRADVDAGLMSVETAMGMNGIDDPGAELERINAERDAQQAAPALEPGAIPPGEVMDDRPTA